MIQDNFAWTFATSDAFTVNYVRNDYIPKLKADIEEMQAIVNQCLANGQATDSAVCLQETIGRQKMKIEVAESRLLHALDAAVRHERPPRIAIVIEGGLVQCVVTNHSDRLDPNLEVQIIDYGTDGVDDDDLLLVPQGDGSLSEARGHIESITKADIDIEGIRPKIND